MAKKDEDLLIKWDKDKECFVNVRGESIKSTKYSMPVDEHILMPKEVEEALERFLYNVVASRLYEPYKE